MIEEKTEAIIFDFGGVIIQLNYQATIDAFKKLGIENFDEMYSQAQQSNLFNDIETGKISSQRFINGLLDYLPSNTSPNKVVEAWNAMILNVPHQNIELLEKLSKKYRIFLLSNTNQLHIDLAYRNWNNVAEKPIKDYFENIYLSHEVGIRKPDGEIFELVCKENQLNKETTLFIDDTEQHIVGAMSVGLKTIHHQSNALLQTLFS